MQDRPLFSIGPESTRESFLRWVNDHPSGQVILQLSGPSKEVIRSQLSGCEEVCFSLSRSAINLIKKINKEYDSIRDDNKDEKILNLILKSDMVDNGYNYFHKMNFRQLNFNQEILSPDMMEYRICPQEYDMNHMQNTESKKAIILLDFPAFVYEEEITYKFLYHEYQTGFFVPLSSLIASLSENIKSVNRNTILLPTASELQLKLINSIKELGDNVAFLKRKNKEMGKTILHLEEEQKILEEKQKSLEEENNRLRLEKEGLIKKNEQLDYINVNLSKKLKESEEGHEKESEEGHEKESKRLKRNEAEKSGFHPSIAERQENITFPFWEQDLSQLPPLEDDSEENEKSNEKQNKRKFQSEN